MTNAEMKKYLKNMDPAKLEGLVLELYKNQPKEKKEVFEITVQNYNEGKELPAKDAIIPDLKRIEKRMDIVINKTLYSHRYIRPATRKIIKEHLNEVYSQLMKVPPQAKCFDQCIAMLKYFFQVVYLIDTDRDHYYLNIYGMLRKTEDDLFRSVLAKILSGGMKLELLYNLARFMRLIFVDSSYKAISFMQIFLAAIKVGDARYELLEYLEDLLITAEEKLKSPTSKTDHELYERTALLYYQCAILELGKETAKKELEERTSIYTLREVVRQFEEWEDIQQEDEEERVRNV